MALELFPFQIEGARWLASKKTALLADAPRLGKAVQSITACDLIGANHVLVVCRGVARGNWIDEFFRWSKRDWHCYPVWGRISVLPFDGPGPHAVITNYENVEHVLKCLSPGFKFDVSIIDESHFVKNLEAKRSQLIFCNTLPNGKDHGIPYFTRRHWATTGTPTPNGLASEMWTTLFSYGSTKLSFWDFAKRFCIVKDTGFGQKIFGTKVPGPEHDAATNKEYGERLDELRELMKDKILRRTQEEVAVQMPKMSFSSVAVPPGKVDLAWTSFWKYVKPLDRRAELNVLLEEQIGIVQGVLDSGHASDEVIELLKAQAKSISTLRRYTALQKLDPACELIADELERGAYNKVVIFAHHRDCILGAAQNLHKFHPFTIYGGSDPRKVASNIKNFQNPKHKSRVAIGQISAAGTSISLSAANHCFFLEESFVPDDNAQAALRLGGVNQPLPIFVRTFCLENSYDYRLQQILREKMSQSAAIFAKKNESTLNTVLENVTIPDELAGLV